MESAVPEITVSPLAAAALPEAAEEDPVARAEREVAESAELLRQWTVARGRMRGWGNPFDLTIQPAIGGEEASITLKRVMCVMTVGRLQRVVQAKLESSPRPDQQRLFIVDGEKGPLEDETLPIGAYGVVPGATLHLAMRDEQAAAARRLARGNVRAAQAKADMEAHGAKMARALKAQNIGRMSAMTVSAVALLVLLSSLLYGCGACAYGVCDGTLFGECVCTGNHLGEYCEDSCGHFGKVANGTCICSGKYTGTFCELQPGEVPSDDSGLGLGWWILIILAILACCCVSALTALYVMAKIMGAGFH